MQYPHVGPPGSGPARVPGKAKPRRPGDWSTRRDVIERRRPGEQQVQEATCTAPAEAVRNIKDRPLGQVYESLPHAGARPARTAGTNPFTSISNVCLAVSGVRARLGDSSDCSLPSSWAVISSRSCCPRPPKVLARSARSQCKKPGVAWRAVLCRWPGCRHEKISEADSLLREVTGQSPE